MKIIKYEDGYYIYEDGTKKHESQLDLNPLTKDEYEYINSRPVREQYFEDEKLICNFCDNNGTSHIECIYGKIEIIKKHNDIFCFFSEDNKINSYIVCDNCFNKILKEALYEYINSNFGNINKIHLDSKGYVYKNACQKLEIEFKKEDSKICQA